jgi:uncharacterized surface protein with fasciclin (FAS1) repeats
MKKFIAAATIALGATATIAPAVDARPPAPNSIVDVAVAANAEGGAYEGVFDTLITAVLCADPAVAATLSQRGQYTVFAPTDDAFALAGLNPSNVCSTFDQATLTEVLLYHVAKGRRDAASVTTSDSIRMLNGEFTAIDGATIDGRNIIVTDVPASNGIIHAIDGVLLPDLLTD